jgi:hypothetical protein
MPYGGAPSTDAADAVRVLVGDTDASNALLDDDTYTLILATEPWLYPQAALAASMLAGKYAQEMRKRVGSLWRFAEQQYDHYRNLAQYLRQESARRSHGAPFAGGISEADIDERKDDTDRPPAFFELGMQDSVHRGIFDQGRGVCDDSSCC